MDNRNTNYRKIKEIAAALGELNDQVVYVGGAVVSFYADDQAAEDQRPTRDIDIFFEIVSYGKLCNLQEKLAAKKFFPALDEDVMCRFKYNDLLVDVMSTDEVGWAMADKWFKPGLKYLTEISIDEYKIKVLHLSYFLATKLTAFLDRKEDPRTSKHFEDIVHILDNSLNLVDEILSSPEDVKQYLTLEFRELLKVEYHEAVLGHLYYETQVERYNIIKEKLSRIINS